MKETNMEHYRDEIETVGHDFAFINGKVAKCNRCAKCDFETEPDEEWESCTIKRVKWLMSEYKPEPVLTEREKGFVECIAGGWLTRDEGNVLVWFNCKPHKETDYWYLAAGDCVNINKDYFPFITWEDEEPWAVTDLRKLKVGDLDA